MTVYKRNLSGRFCPLLLTSLALVLPVLWGTGPLAAETIQARQADAPLALVIDGSGAEIWRPSGTETIPLAQAAGLGTIEALDDGWVAAGNIQDGAATELYLLISAGGETNRLPVPAGRYAQRGEPALLVGDSRLEGLAWLEGTRQEDLVVLAARWNGTAWSEPEVVSPQGVDPVAGAQLALDGVILDDGSWLLVWAAVDGPVGSGDDEILWSRRGEDGWSPPERVHAANNVPDITPSVAALPSGGAVVAWSALDGRHYRIRQARFDGENWQSEPAFGAEGSTRPGFVAHGLERTLLYHSVVPDVWSLRELDQDGVARRGANLQVPIGSRPVLDLGDPEAAVLFWPDVDSAPSPGGGAAPNTPDVAIPWQDLD
jgi:hypothetical protein